jgi:hypothetical protein
VVRADGTATRAAISRGSSPARAPPIAEWWRRTPSTTGRVRSRRTASAGAGAAWLRRVWWAFPLVAAFEIAVMAGLGLVLQPRHVGFYLGVGIGAAGAMVLVLIESPPPHIDRWRQGADGAHSRGATARAVAVDHSSEGPIRVSGATVARRKPESGQRPALVSVLIYRR